MNNSLSLPRRKVNYTHDERNGKCTVNANLVTINEKVNLTKIQYGVLNTICDTYEQSVSEYMHEALIESMRFDITISLHVFLDNWWFLCPGACLAPF